MAKDLKSMSKVELEKLKEDVERALERASERELKQARAEMEKIAASHGFTLEDIAGTSNLKAVKKKMPGAKKPPKFRNPEDPVQTWSGRGRKPRWIVDAEAAGRDIQDFLI